MPYSQATAEINLSALENNILEIKSRLNPKTKLMAAVKANAYGHGAVAVSKKLYESGIRNFAVACIQEALEIRSEIKDCEILILGFSHPSDAGLLAQNNITQALYGEDFARALSESAVKAGAEVKTHLALDTGMGRIGFKDSASAVKAASLKGIKVEGAFTHFSCADGTDEKSAAYTKKQFERFLSLTHDIESAGIPLETRHCANSAAIFHYPEYQLDMARAGIILYGLAPNPDDADTYKCLKPVMSVKSLISNVKTVSEGEKIGYGGQFTAHETMKIATIPIGYADGYHRSFAVGDVLICGKRAKIVGRICMDQMMVDITDIPDAHFLSPVTIIGESGDECITADELAGRCGTISYQIVCDISNRVKRIYK